MIFVCVSIYIMCLGLYGCAHLTYLDIASTPSSSRISSCRSPPLFAALSTCKGFRVFLKAFFGGFRALVFSLWGFGAHTQTSQAKCGSEFGVC